MVQLYMVRHAVAEPRGDKWPDDTRRPLSADGISRMRKAARGLVRLGVKLDAILTSPLVRARQTADIIAAAFDTRPPIVVIDSMSPEATYDDLIVDLQKHARRTRIALVGHEPNIGEMTAKLAGSRRRLDFKKGAVCHIEVESVPPDKPGTLRWFVTPSILRAVRK